MLRRATALIAAAALLAFSSAAAPSQTTPQPIGFLGVHAMMTPSQASRRLEQKGYACGPVRDRQIHCSKRMGDNPRVPGAGAFATVTLRLNGRERILFNCLAVRDGLGKFDIAFPKNACSNVLREKTLAKKLAQLGVLKPSHKPRRFPRSQFAACFGDPKGKDEACFWYDRGGGMIQLSLSRKA